VDIEGVEDSEEATSTVSTSYGSSICHFQQQPPLPPPARRAPPHHPPQTAPPTRSHDPQDNDDDGDDTETASSSLTISSVRNIAQLTAPMQPPIEDENEEHSDHEKDIPGRLPTPELKKIPPERKIRHHLDRTTPCKGAILTSPPKDIRHGWNPEEIMSEADEQDHENPLAQTVAPLGVTETLPKYRRDMTSRAPIYPTHNNTLTVPHTAPQHTSKRPDITATKKSRTSTQVHKSVQTQPRSAPTHQPTSNTTTTRRVRATEGGNEDLECSFCGSPLRRPPAKAHRKTRLVTDNRQLKTHKSSVTTTLPIRAPPQQSRTTNLPLGHHPKQHQLRSGSLLSLSSCSVASEVLERAQRRKETFWSQRETAAT